MSQHGGELFRLVLKPNVDGQKPHQTVDEDRNSHIFFSIQHSIYFSFISKHTFSSTDRCTRVNLPWLPESSYAVPSPAKDAPPNSAETRLGQKKSN